ncbi:chaperonin 10-like protein [Irpex lacteus]|nr:chaperonin 10-like protein [Irpex lacteus]
MSESTHRAIAITSPGTIEQITLPTPTPTGNEVLIEVEYTALIPFDTYQIDKAYFVQGYPHVLGFASAGQVKAVGNEVDDLKVGDKVAAFNFPTAKNKGLQEFALVLRPVVAKLPTNYNLAEAASIPDNYTTAAFTLFGTPNLALPLPSSFPAPSPPPNADQPILIHGGGSSSGQYTIQLLRLAGYTQIYATASPRNHEYLKSLGATHVFDYRSPSLAQSILAATGGKKVPIVIDTIGAKPSIEAYSPVLGKETRLAILLPVKKGPTVRNEEQDDMVTDFPPWLYEATNGATIFGVATFKIFEDPVALDFMPKFLPKLLESNALRPNRLRLFKESDGPLLERVNNALDLFRENKISGEKVVIELKWN